MLFSLEGCLARRRSCLAEDNQEIVPTPAMHVVGCRPLLSIIANSPHQREQPRNAEHASSSALNRCTGLYATCCTSGMWSARKARISASRSFIARTIFASSCSAVTSSYGMTQSRCPYT